MSHEHSVCNVDNGILASTGYTVLIGGLINLKICGGGAINLSLSFAYVKAQSRGTFIDTLRHVLLSLSPFLPGLLEEENPRNIW